MFRIFFSTYPFRVRLPSFYGFGKEVAGAAAESRTRSPIPSRKPAFCSWTWSWKSWSCSLLLPFAGKAGSSLCHRSWRWLTFAFCFEFANAFFLWVFLMFCSSSQERCFLVATKGTCRGMLCSNLPRKRRRSLAWQQLTDITSGIEASRFPGQCVTKRPTVI